MFNAIKILALFMFCMVSQSVSNTAAKAGGTNGLLSYQKAIDNWQEITTVEDLWELYPEKVRRIFASLDLQHPGLEQVNTALQSADTVAAGKALIQYYKQTDNAGWLLSPSYLTASQSDRELSDQLLEDIFTRAEVSAEVPKLDNGAWDWTFTGPEKDDEFGYTLNRHGSFNHLLKTWHETGNAAYAEKFDELVRDWIIHNPLPDQSEYFWEVHRTSDELDWRDIGEVVWRDLDAGIRLGESWVHSFYGFQQAEAFSPASRLLMLYSIPIHAAYLKDYHKDSHNWTTMEMNGLGLVGLTFPEYKRADEWAGYALEVMENEINGQVYPDGVQHELSAKTQWVALNRFELLVENYRNAGRSVSDAYLERIEAMYDHLAYSVRPDGHQPLNNDSDREDLRPRILKAADIYDRPDWTYIATNGERGEEPEGLASVVFPWSGIHVMRSGWDAMSHWGFYHTGPYGTGHQHRDKSHLSVHAYGRDLLVDGGRFTHEDYFSFDPTIWRGYFRSSFSHNLILVDGAGQNAGPRIADRPLEEGKNFVNTSTFDYAVDTFSSGYEGVDGQADHTRAVLYVKDKYWVVVDHIATDRPRTLETLWHYAPDVNAGIEAGQVVSNDSGKGNLRIVPAGDIQWDLEMVEGQTEPFIQGWYSITYGEKEPNPTAIYTTNIEGDATFAWVLVPADGQVPEVQAELVDEQTGLVRVTVEGEDPVLVTVPLQDGEPGFK
ncbi:MAG: alginate lyase family protein [Balneolales bacterium]